VLNRYGMTDVPRKTTVLKSRERKLDLIRKHKKHVSHRNQGAVKVLI
jgi:hypothetical protein